MHSPRSKSQRPPPAQREHGAASQRGATGLGALHATTQHRPQLLPVLGGGDDADEEAPEDGEGRGAATLGTTSLDAGVSMGALDYGYLYHCNHRGAKSLDLRACATP